MQLLSMIAVGVESGNVMDTNRSRIDREAYRNVSIFVLYVFCEYEDRRRIMRRPSDSFEVLAKFKVTSVDVTSIRELSSDLGGTA
jgi:hypothetical protein